MLNKNCPNCGEKKLYHNCEIMCITESEIAVQFECSACDSDFKEHYVKKVGVKSCDQAKN
jgi:uncharacterized protein (DUF983 family)